MHAMAQKAYKAAKRDGRSYYIYPTAYRWAITTIKPPHGVQYTEVEPDGAVTYHLYDHPSAVWTHKSLGNVAA